MIIAILNWFFQRFPQQDQLLGLHTLSGHGAELKAKQLQDTFADSKAGKSGC